MARYSDRRMVGMEKPGVLQLKVTGVQRNELRLQDSEAGIGPRLSRPAHVTAPSSWQALARPDGNA